MDYIIAKSGPLTGCSVLPVDWQKFNDFYIDCVYHAVGYEMDAKDPHPGSGNVDFQDLDCSGFARTILMYACQGAVNDMPDGSWNQMAYFARNALKRSEASDTSLHDSILRVSIHTADDLDRTGHIWFTLNGKTYECYGGHGVGSRVWNAQLEGHTLSQLADDVFCLCDLTGAL